MIYDLIAPIYDRVNGELDYSKWADFLVECSKKHSDVKPELVLDLGCGTGRMTLELARRGYDMTGVDYSPEMLDIARTRAAEQGIDNVLWLCQDFTALDLYGTVDLAVSCLDCINHLTTTAELKEALALVHNFLVPDGLFIFDINGRKKFETTYSDRAYVFDGEDGICIWQNNYNPSTRICDFYITYMEDDGDGKYERYDEMQSERMYTLRAMNSALKSLGFIPLAAYSDFDFTNATDDDERIYIVAKCKK